MKSEAQLQSLIRRRYKTINKAYRDIAEARKELIEICKHPNFEPYVWEWDNGYGLQRKIEGFRCEDCLAIDYWGHGKWSVQ